MDEFKTEETGQVSAASPRWTGLAFIALAHQLNEQCVELLCELAGRSNLQELPRFVLQNRDLWRLIKTEARRLVAEFPFVIIDLRFNDEEPWRRAATGRSMSRNDSTLHNGLSHTLFEDLAVETLLFARQAAREDVNVAKAMFAMTPPVATLIASLTLPQVRTVAIANTQQLRVRWDNDPEFWRDLLVACRAGDERSLGAIRHHGKLLFCGELASFER